jgi:hypothetical protein
MSTRRGQLPTPLNYASVVQFLDLRWLPGRVCSWQAAAILGFEVQHIPVLITARLLKALGNPPPNAPKYFHTKTLLRLAEDERWMDRASDALVKHWANRNTRKSKSHSKSSGPQLSLN